VNKNVKPHEFDASLGQVRNAQASVDASAALHDIGNALTVIRAWLDRVQAAADDGQAAGEGLSVIRRETERAQALARRALGVPSDGAEVLSAQPFGASSTSSSASTLRSIVDELVHAVSPMLGETVIHVGAVPAQPIAFGQEFSRVLHNLVQNALRFAAKSESGAVWLNARLENGSLLFEVTDSGPGVPRDLCTAIFTGTTTRNDGAGVGLASSRALCRSHGGDLWLASNEQALQQAIALPEPQGPCVPARFQFRWPCAEWVRMEAAQPQGKRQAMGGQRILVLEDDEAIGFLVQTALESWGASVALVTSLEDALVALAPSAPPKFDLALIDWSPLRLLSEGREDAMASLRQRATTLVLMSGDVAAPPFEHVLRKPFAMDELLAIVESLLPPKAQT
jgi:CheY-like chemotaxis protein/two-component sensor histidine kinase